MRCSTHKDQTKGRLHETWRECTCSREDFSFLISLFFSSMVCCAVFIWFSRSARWVVFAASVATKTSFWKMNLLFQQKKRCQVTKVCLPVHNLRRRERDRTLSGTLAAALPMRIFNISPMNFVTEYKRQMTLTFVLSSVSLSCNFCWTSCSFSPFSLRVISSLSFSSCNPCKSVTWLKVRYRQVCLVCLYLTTRISEDLFTSSKSGKNSALAVFILRENSSVVTLALALLKQAERTFMVCLWASGTERVGTWAAVLDSCSCLWRASIFSSLFFAWVCRFCSLVATFSCNVLWNNNNSFWTRSNGLSSRTQLFSLLQMSHSQEGSARPTILRNTFHDSC